MYVTISKASVKNENRVVQIGSKVLLLSDGKPVLATPNYAWANTPCQIRKAENEPVYRQKMIYNTGQSALPMEWEILESAADLKIKASEILLGDDDFGEMETLADTLESNDSQSVNVIAKKLDDLKLVIIIPEKKATK